jgi:Uma2 family endonuclease
MEAIRTKPETQEAPFTPQPHVLAIAEHAPLRLFTREEYHAMAKAGILRPDERVELIEGVIVNKMSPIGLWHTMVVRTLITEIVGRLAKQVQIDVQGAIVILNSEPQPDLVMFKFGLKRKPLAEDILLVIEVSDSTASEDKNVKASLYARAGIVEYWIVERAQDRIIQYLEPKDGEYRKIRTWTRGETISTTTQPTFTVAVDVVLGDLEDEENGQNIASE